MPLRPGLATKCRKRPDEADAGGIAIYRVSSSSTPRIEKNPGAHARALGSSSAIFRQARGGPVAPQAYFLACEALLPCASVEAL